MILSAVGVLVPQATVDNDKLATGLWLELFHGRTSPDEELNDWGANGPLIGPLEYVHSTYCTDVKFAFVTAEEHDKYFPRERSSWDPATGEVLSWQRDAWLTFTEDLLVYNGMYYGDWSVFYVKGESNSLFRR